MTTPTRAEPVLAQDSSTFWRTLALVVGILAAYNVVVNSWLPSALYVPVNLVVAALLLAVARRSGLSWSDIGLDSAKAGSGLRWGAVGMVVVAAVLAIGILIPWTRSFFEDDRADVSAAEMVYQVLFRIPFGTVVLEEVAFRGVLLGVMLVRWRPFAAATWSSAVFGFWHVLPSLGVVEANADNTAIADVSDEIVFQVGTVAAAVISTWIAGYVFSWMRIKSESLVAPVMLHVATNCFSFFGAWMVFNYLGGR